MSDRDVFERAASQLRVVPELVIDELPRGHVHRVLVELTDDALGRPLRLPMLVARGQKDGPVFGLTAALHGNELNGIPVIHRLFEQIDLHHLRGTLAAVVVVNVPGFQLHQRELDNGTDLNTIMPGRAHGNAAQVYAFRVVDRIVRHFDRLVDLHTASFGRVNSLYVRADMESSDTARMAYLLRPQIILHNPPSDRTLRGAAMDLGIPAVTLEIGDPQRFQPSYIRNSLQGIRRLLADAKMLPKRKVQLGPMPIVCEKSKWMYTGRGGLLDVYPKLTERVRHGQVIARLTDVFGDVLKEYKAPRDSVVIGKSVNPAGPTGARIAHLGIEAPEGRFLSRDGEELG